MKLSLWSISVLLATACSQVPDNAHVQGGALYAEHCASCHGDDLEGGARAPALRNAAVSTETDALSEMIEKGIEGSEMPGFEQTLTRDEVRNLVRFLKAYKEPNNPALPYAAEASSKKSFDPVPGLVQSLDYSIRADVFVDGLETPWALAFLNRDTAIVTERPGRLRLISGGELHPKPVANTPEVLISEHEWNQGGLLDVAVAQDSSAETWVYLAFSDGLDSAEQSGAVRGMTKVVRGKISGHHWTDEETVFEASPSAYSDIAWHYGGRLAIDQDGHVFFSVGDRGKMAEARDLGRPNGKIHRLMADGSVPADNPFAAQPRMIGSIFSLGNRNPQGLAINPADGSLWETEHGPRGGDELNIIRKGADYGWPTITYGIDYDGTPISDLTEKEGLQQPIHYWRPSIAVSGLTSYDGEEFPLWRGKLLVTGLASRDLRLLTLDGDRVLHEEIVFRFEGRPYEPVVGPDGEIYIVLDTPGRIVRLTSQEERRR